MKKHTKRNWSVFRLLFLLIIPVFAFASVANAQKRIVKGTVVDGETGEPLPGVTIVVKGTTIGAVTDIEGNYALKAPANAILFYSFIGYESQEIQTANKTNINVKLKVSSIGLDEVVAIGYGVQKKKVVTGAVAQVKSEELARTTTADLGSALQGQIAGVSITSSSGQPGSEANILIRGYSSVMDGQNKPLYVVDGIPYDDDPKISISEIESVDVLKDAASASIYGTRGAGGVILITTKQGKKGMITISANSEYGLQHITSSVPQLSPTEDVYVQLLQNEQSQSKKAFGELESTISNNKAQFNYNTNLNELILEDWAPIQNHSVNVTGGKEDLTYSVNGSLYDQEGVVYGSDYTRLNVRANTTFKKGKWNIRTSIGFRRDEKNSAPGDALLLGYRYHAYQPPFDLESNEMQDASDSDNDTQRIGQMAKKLLKTDYKIGNNHFGNIQFDYAVNKALKLTFRTGVNYTDNTRVQITPDFRTYKTDGTVVPTTPISSNKSMSDTYSKYTNEFIVSWSKKIKAHDISLVLAGSSEKTNFSYFYAQREGQSNDGVTVLDGYTGDATVGNDQKDYESTMLGTLGRLQYSYNDKYLLSASFRRDGSSQFRAEKWGWFPSASVGWNVSEEKFWKPLKSTINSFKIRASYGETGNDRFARYGAYNVVQVGQDYFWGTNDQQSLAYGTSQLKYYNQDLIWETSIEKNIGVDLNFLKNKIQFSADVYQNSKEDLLFDVIMPVSTGVSGGNGKMVQNVGNMENRGIELALGYRHNGKFSWKADVTFSKNINEVTKTSETNPFINLANSYLSNRATTDDLVTVITKGYEAGAFFLLEQQGVIKTQEQLDAYLATLNPTQKSNFKLGDLQYVDQNGDGYIDESDRTYVGSGMADFEMGFNFSANYKNFDLSMQWFGSYGAEVLNGSRAYAYQSGTHKDLLYGWSPYNADSDIPAYRGPGKFTDSYRSNSDYYLEDGSYIRLRNVSLGYTIPRALLSKFNVSSIRLYLASQNPITITNYTGFDPEIGGNGLSTRGLDRGNYPVTSQYRAGVQLKF